jgi:hypothetical protein
MKLSCTANCWLSVLLTALASSVCAEFGSYEAIEDTCHHPGLLHAASFASNHFCRTVLVQAIPTMDCATMQFEVIRASSQVVAGTNFMQTVAIVDNSGKCLIAFQGNTFLPLPYTQEDPMVDMSSIEAMSCKEVDYMGQCNTALAAEMTQISNTAFSSDARNFTVAEAPFDKEAEVGGPLVDWADVAEEQPDANSVNEGDMTGFVGGVAETSSQSSAIITPAFDVRAESLESPDTTALVANEFNSTSLVFGLPGNGTNGTRQSLHLDGFSGNATSAPIVGGLSGNDTYAPVVNGLSSNVTSVEGGHLLVGDGDQSELGIQKQMAEAGASSAEVAEIVGELEGEVEEIEMEDEEEDEEGDESTWKFAGRTDECSRFGWSPADGIVFKCDKAAYVCGASIEFREKFMLLLEDHIVEGCDMGEVTEIFSSRGDCNFFPKVRSSCRFPPNILD